MRAPSVSDIRRRTAAVSELTLGVVMASDVRWFAVWQIAIEMWFPSNLHLRNVNCVRMMSIETRCSWRDERSMTGHCAGGSLQSTSTIHLFQGKPFTSALQVRLQFATEIFRPEMSQYA